VYAERRDDADILKENGWTMDCQSPFEISRDDGSRATGMAAKIVMETLRREYEEDTAANRQI
jgi:hypothetical protein